MTTIDGGVYKEFVVCVEVAVILIWDYISSKRICSMCVLFISGLK